MAIKTTQGIEVISHNYYVDASGDIHAVIANYYKGFKEPYIAWHTINHKAVEEMRDTVKSTIKSFEKRIVKEFKLKKIGG